MFGRDSTKKNTVKRRSTERRSAVVQKKVVKRSLRKAGKGASRSEVKQPFVWKIELPQLSFHWLNVKNTVVASMLFATVAAIYASFIAVDTVMDVAVENVKIEGQLENQSRTQISDIINRYTAEGFVNVDLQELHDELQGLPWVYSVRIKRMLPDGLVINLQEEKAVASWNGASLINNYGDVFTPKSALLLPGLVEFNGDNHQHLLDVYQQVRGLLPLSQQPIRSLAIDKRQVIRIELNSGAELVANVDNLDEQLQRWQKIVDKAMKDKFDKVSRADLRYSNGVAVAWKNKNMSSNKMQLGSR